MAEGERERDVRYGHDLGVVQDASGVDLLLLEKQLSLSVEERFLQLERHAAFVEELCGRARR